jgi:hypothetical protein
VLARDDLVPARIAGIQTFGELVHFHPHIPSPTMIAARNAAKNCNAGRRSPLKSCVSEQEKRKKWQKTGQQSSRGVAISADEAQNFH